MNNSNYGGGLSMTGSDTSESSVSAVDDRVSKIETLVKQFEMGMLPRLLDVQSSRGFGTNPPYEVIPYINFTSPLQIKTINVPDEIIVWYDSSLNQNIISKNPLSINLNDGKYVQFGGGTHDTDFNCDTYFHYNNKNNIDTKMEIGDLINKTFLIDEEIDELRETINTYDNRITTNVNNININNGKIADNSALILKNTTAIKNQDDYNHTNTSYIQIITKDLMENTNTILQHTGEIRNIQADITKLKTTDHFTLTDKCIQSNHLADNIDIITTGNITCNTATIQKLICPEYDSRFAETKQQIDTATDLLYKRIITPKVNICIVAISIPNAGDVYNGKLAFFPIHGYPNVFEYKHPSPFKIQSFIVNDDELTKSPSNMTLTFNRKDMTKGLSNNDIYNISTDTAVVNFPNFQINSGWGVEEVNKMNYLQTPYSVPINSRLSVSYSYKLLDGAKARIFPPRFFIYGYLDEK